MDLNDYFNPVSLEAPDDRYLSEEALFCRNIAIHTPSIPVKDVKGYRVALIGVPEDRGTAEDGSANATDQVRNKLYQLYRISRGLKIIDLGNLKQGETLNDTYYGLRDVLYYLHGEGIISIIMGGSQDITYGAYLALEKLNYEVSMTTIDSCLDLGWRDDGSAASTYLAKIFHDHSSSLFNYANIGHQVYFVDDAVLEYLEKHNFNGIRLGEARADLRDTEPVLRDTHLLSIDMSAIRYADAPRTTHPSPNGLYGEEICQLARYAGLSEKLSIAGIFEIIPGDSKPGITSHLAAQVIWYILDGIASRMDEWPLQNDEEFRKYIVEVDEADQVLVFYKSQRSGRWWMEVPSAGKKENVRIMAASYSDYQQACSQELPERWFRLFKLLN